MPQQRLSWSILNRHCSRRHRPYNGNVSKPICDAQTAGFIHHASGFPLEVKRVWFDRPLSRDREAASGELGLIFESDEYIKPGSVLEVTIPSPREETRFRGRVVLVRGCGDYFEIGIWLHSTADASRVRIVEQICHIESYMRERKFRDGPYNLNRDRLVEEWIMLNAGTVPRL